MYTRFFLYSYTNFNNKEYSCCVINTCGYIPQVHTVWHTHIEID